MSVEDIKNIETHFDPWQYKWNDVYIWPLIKDMVFFYASSQNTTPLKKSIRIRIKEKVQFFWSNNLLRSFFDYYSIKPCKTLIFSMPDARRLYQGKQIDSLFDRTVKQSTDTFLAEWPVPTYHKQNNFTEKSKHMYLDYLYAKVVFLAKYKPIKLALSLPKEFHISPKQLTEIISRFVYYKQELKKFLKRRHVEHVIFKSNYCIQHQALCAAAKELGITTTEQQHGYIDSHSRGYIYRIPDKKIMASNNWPFPKKIRVFGKYYQQLLLQHSDIWTQENIEIGGYELLQFVYSQQSSSPPLQSSRKTILISSQWIFQQQWHNLLSELLPLLPEQYDILYKTHPREDNAPAFFKDLFVHKNFSINTADTLIYELFPRCTIHSSVNSTTIHESLVWALPNILFLPHGQQPLSEFIETPGVFYANSAQEFLTQIQAIQNLTPHEFISLKAKGKLYFTV